MSQTFTGWLMRSFDAFWVIETMVATWPSNSAIPAETNTVGAKPSWASGASPKTYVPLASRWIFEPDAWPSFTAASALG